MSAGERSAITNAIWLCSTCHKLVDDDEARYPAGLLFEWQREHDRLIGALVGKAGAEARRRYDDRHLESFGKLSYLAERIITEKDGLWEYRLTLEVLRFELGPVLRRWRALKEGLYVKPSMLVTREHFFGWLSSKTYEVSAIAKAFGSLINTEFARSWGEPGSPGSDIEIVEVCRLYRETCESALAWEEGIRFLSADDIFDEVRELHVGKAGRIIDEAAKLSEFLTEMLAPNPKSGTFRLDLKLDLPEGWGDAVGAALQRAAETMGLR